MFYSVLKKVVTKNCSQWHFVMNKQMVGMLSRLAAAIAGTEGGNTENNTHTLNF
jgi:hypothetical protein